MKSAKSKINDFDLECLKGFIGKKIMNITLPPNAILQPQRSWVIANELTMILYDAEWGSLRIKPRILRLKGIESFDLDHKQGLNLFISKASMPSDNIHLAYPPSYGTSIEYSEFVIHKIEIYGASYQLDANGKCVGKLLKKTDYVKNNVVVEYDSVIIFYGQGDLLLVLEAHTGLLSIGFSTESKKEIISRPINMHDNPIFLEINYVIT
jgi:hypothetical protein